MRQPGKKYPTAVTLDCAQGTVFPGCHLSLFTVQGKHQQGPVELKEREKKKMAVKYYIVDPQTRNRSSCSLANHNRPHNGLGSEISLGQALIYKGVLIHFEKQGNIKTVYLK